MNTRTMTSNLLLALGGLAALLVVIFGVYALSVSSSSPLIPNTGSDTSTSAPIDGSLQGTVVATSTDTERNSGNVPNHSEGY